MSEQEERELVDAAAADEAGDDDNDRSERMQRLRQAAYEAELASGDREATEEKVRRNIFLRIGIIGFGTVVFLLGIAMLALPGPGLVVVAAGLAILALEVPFAARLLERVKDRLPKDDDGKLPKSAIVTMVVMFALAGAASIAWMIYK